MKEFIAKRALLTLLAGVVVTSSIHAGDVVKKLSSQRARILLSIKIKLPREYATYHAYLLKARRGQRISVKLTTDDPDASFSVFETKQLGPDEDMLFGNQPDTRQWSGRAPITSEFSIQVYGVRDFDDRPSGAGYSVEITLQN